MHNNKRKKTSTTNLPASLREELGIGENGKETQTGEVRREGTRGARGGGGSYRARVVGRKEARKAERKDKKASKSRPVKKEHFQSPKQASFVARSPRQVDQNRRPSQAIALDKGKARDIGYQKVKDIPSNIPIASKGQRKHVGEEEATPLQRLMALGQANDINVADSKRGQVSKKRRIDAPLSGVEKQEEDEIAWLEAHLGGKTGGGSKTKKLSGKKDDKEEDEGGEGEGIDGAEDGLDDLLEDLDRFYPGMYDGSASEGSNMEDDSELEEDSEAEEEDESGEEQDNSMLDESEMEFEGEDDLIEEDQSSSSELQDDVNTSEAGRQEDVVEAVVATERSEPSTGRYIPPALRRKAAETTTTESEEVQKLRRQAKGLLNRLGEGNVESIVMEITESLYRQYSRADVTQAITMLVIQTVSSSSNLVETFVVLHAAFIASLHRLVGLEFGAHFLQTIVEDWLKFYIEAREKQELDVAGVEEIGKESKNLIVLFANLYNLGVVACPLVFDIIKLTLGIEEGKQPRSMTELDVELLLKVVKSSGPQLRHDDPSSLKTIVQLAQEQQSKLATSSRSKFMLEALEDLKNNRTKAIQGQGLEQQSVARMKKYLANLSRKRTVRTQEPLRVGLKDLREVDKRGKWWLVGAAWAGYDFKAEGEESQKIEKRQEEVGTVKEEAKRDALIQIARQHGMNTGIRQNIFVILISSQDYLEALEKLQSLKFKKDNQRREIIRVLLHCIGSESNYNPYYVVLASRLAVDEIGTRFTLQYCLWDFLRDLGEKGVGGRSVIERNEEEDSEDESEGKAFPENMSNNRIANVARAYGWWFAKGALSLSAMKVIEFTNLKSLGVEFLQQVIVHLLLSSQTSSPALTLALARQKKGSGQMRIGGKDDIDETAKQSIESVFVKGTFNNVTISQGLLFFLERNLKPKVCIRVATKLGADVRTREQLVWARGVAKQVLKVASHSTSSGVSKTTEM